VILWEYGAKGHVRRKYLNLPAREEIHDVFEADQHCPRCELPYDPPLFDQEWKPPSGRHRHGSGRLEGGAPGLVYWLDPWAARAAPSSHYQPGPFLNSSLGAG